MINTQKRLNLDSPLGEKNTTFRLYRRLFAGLGNGICRLAIYTPSGEPVPVSLDVEKLAIASVNQISTLLGFDHLTPRYSWPQIRNKVSQQVIAHEVTIAHDESMDNMTSQEIEREKRIADAAETFQAIVNHSKISVCQDLHLRTEDSDPSCKIIDFSTNYKTLKDMADQFELLEQVEHPNLKILIL